MRSSKSRNFHDRGDGGHFGGPTEQVLSDYIEGVRVSFLIATEEEVGPEEAASGSRHANLELILPATAESCFVTALVRAKFRHS